MSVSEVLAARAAGILGGAQVAVGGYWSVNVDALFTTCAVGGPDSTLEIRCHDGAYGITEQPEPIMDLDASGTVTPASGPHLTPWIPDDVQAQFPLLPRTGRLPLGGMTLPVPIVLVGHFDDPRAAQCRPVARQRCRDRLVLDKVAWINVAAAVTPSPTPSDDR